MKASLTTCVIAIMCLSSSSRATSISWSPNAIDSNDLDHQSVYNWRVDNVTLNPASIRV
jgi:hypothetical protein